MVIYYLWLLLEFFTITGNIIIILDFRDCADCLDTYLKTASERVQLMDKPQNMHSTMQHIPKQKLKRYFRKETGFYQLLQHAALHPSLCSLSWAVGRDRGSLATSLLLLWWEKQWQKENVHLPSTASCRLWAKLLIEQMASSAHGLLTREVYLKIHTHSPLHFSGQEDCPDTQIIGAAVVPPAEWEKQELWGTVWRQLYVQQFGNASGKRILPWLICNVELITTFATPPPLLPSQ